MKSSNFYKIVLLLALPVALLIHTSCGWTNPEFTLTVVVGEGITGTPETGTYVYKEFEEVEYKYEFQEGAIQPEIYLNNLRKLTLEGTLVIYNDITLTIEQIDIRREWTLFFYQQDEDDTEWKITFTGPDLRSGTFSDDREYYGTWEVTGSNDITFSYDNW
ncbi:MAG: hypothetical protein KAT17_08050, partial [Candidatus Aminicenantes bacterium]|nr:hypothetical protein [Candidatus Aminicenantes bacterium]